MGGLCTYKIQNPTSVKYTHIYKEKGENKNSEENNILFELNVIHYKLILDPNVFNLFHLINTKSLIPDQDRKKLWAY